MRHVNLYVRGWLAKVGDKMKGLYKSQHCTFMSVGYRSLEIYVMTCVVLHFGKVWWRCCEMAALESRPSVWESPSGSHAQKGSYVIYLKKVRRYNLFIIPDSESWLNSALEEVLANLHTYIHTIYILVSYVRCLYPKGVIISGQIYKWKSRIYPIHSLGIDRAGSQSPHSSSRGRIYNNIP